MKSQQNKFDVSITSEIGELEGVILHTPGLEIENMTPGNAERALYATFSISRSPRLNTISCASFSKNTRMFFRSESFSNRFSIIPKSGPAS